MDAASSLNLVSEKAETHKQNLIDILNDPRKTLYFMLALAVSGALLFILYNSIANYFTTRQEVKKLQNLTPKVEEKTAVNFDLKRKQDIDRLSFAIDSYYSKNQIYPQALSSLVPQYLASLPSDPETSKEYSYRVSLDFKSYEVWALLDTGREYLRVSP